MQVAILGRVFESVRHKNNQECLSWLRSHLDDVAAVIYFIQRAADQNDARCQTMLGFCYDIGVGVEKDFREAARLYRLAAAYSCVVAQYLLGNLLANANNWPEAIDLYQLGAKQRYPGALHSLSNCYQYGKGVRIDHLEAARLLHAAVEQGDGETQLKMLSELRQHPGTTSVLEDAYRIFFRHCADSIYLESLYGLANCYDCGIGVSQDHSEAARLYRIAADRNHKDAQFELADYYLSGTGVEKDESEGVRLLRKSADQGNAEAQQLLGGCCYAGIGTERNEKEAARWFHLSAAAGNPRGLWHLGICCLRGIVVNRDYIRAVQLFKKAADLNYTLAQSSLGYCLECGKGIRKNSVEAVRMYSLAAEKNCAEAQFRLAGCYETGCGVAIDLVNALRLYGLAAKQAYPEASQKIDQLLAATTSVPEITAV
jgi:TPR repeat protein